MAEIDEMEAHLSQKEQQKFKSLRKTSRIYLIFGIVLFCLSIIMTIFVASLHLGEEYIGIFWSVGLMIVSLIALIIFLGIQEMISLLIDIEENTRVTEKSTADLVENLKKSK